MAQATYAQDMRQLLHLRRTLVSFRSRFCAKGWDQSWLHAGKLAYTENPSKTAAKNPCGSMVHLAFMRHAVNKRVRLTRGAAHQ